MKQMHPGSSSCEGWDWAISALTDFRKRVGREGTAIQTKQLSLALVGATQEGKTSVALRLLGVELKHFAEIREALRGGRKDGESATPVVTIYEASSERPTKKVLNNICSRVHSARETRSNEILHITIPAASGFVARVIDLVGVEAADDAEAKYALAQATKWLYQADIHAFVSGMDHLSDLAKVHRPGPAKVLQFWKLSRSTSLILFTKAFEIPEAIDELREYDDPEQLLVAAKDRCERVFSKEVNKKRPEGSPIITLPLILPLCLKDSNDTSLNVAQEATTLALQSIKELFRDNPSRFKVKAGFSLPKILSSEYLQLKTEYKNIMNRYDGEIASKERKLTELKELTMKRKDNIDYLLNDKSVLEAKRRQLMKLLKSSRHANELYETLEGMRRYLIESRCLHDANKWCVFQDKSDEFADNALMEMNNSIKALIFELKDVTPSIGDKDALSLKRVAREEIDHYREEIPCLKKRHRFLGFLRLRFHADDTRRAVFGWTERLRNSLVNVFKNHQAIICESKLSFLKSESAKKLKENMLILNEEKRSLLKDEADESNCRSELSELRSIASKNLLDLEQKKLSAKDAVRESQQYAQILSDRFVDTWELAVANVNNPQNVDSMLGELSRLCSLSEELKQVVAFDKERSVEEVRV